jgi:hypothetical protein
MQLMGASAAGVLLLLSSLTAALWLTRELASVALGETARAVLIRAMTALLITVVLMTGMQRQTRATHVAAQGSSTGENKP